jgi:hypothetical protein
MRSGVSFKEAVDPEAGVELENIYAGGAIEYAAPGSLTAPKRPLLNDRKSSWAMSKLTTLWDVRASANTRNSGAGLPKTLTTVLIAVGFIKWLPPDISAEDGNLCNVFCFGRSFFFPRAQIFNLLSALYLWAVRGGMFTCFFFVMTTNAFLNSNGQGSWTYPGCIADISTDDTFSSIADTSTSDTFSGGGLRTPSPVPWSSPSRPPSPAPFPTLLSSSGGDNSCLQMYLELLQPLVLGIFAASVYTWTIFVGADCSMI